MSRSAMAWLVGLMLGAACNGRAEEAAAPSRPDVVPSCPRTSGVNPEEARTMSPSTNPTGGARWLERLKTENPETFERLMQLRDTDPAKFHSDTEPSLRIAKAAIPPTTVSVRCFQPPSQSASNTALCPTSTMREASRKRATVAASLMMESSSTR